MVNNLRINHILYKSLLSLVSLISISIFFSIELLINNFNSFLDPFSISEFIDKNNLNRSIWLHRVIIELAVFASPFISIYEFFFIFFFEISKQSLLDFIDYFSFLFNYELEVFCTFVVIWILVYQSFGKFSGYYYEEVVVNFERKNLENFWLKILLYVFSFSSLFSLYLLFDSSGNFLITGTANCKIIARFFMINFNVFLFKFLISVILLSNIFIFLCKKDLFLFRDYTGTFINILLFSSLMIFSLLFLSSFDLFALFLTIISINILMYVLLISDDQTPRESIIKYFVLSTVSTLFFLGSVTLTLIFFKNTNFLIINQIIKYNILNVNISNSFALSEITWGPFNYNKLLYYRFNGLGYKFDYEFFWTIYIRRDPVWTRQKLLMAEKMAKIYLETKDIIFTNHDALFFLKFDRDLLFTGYFGEVHKLNNESIIVFRRSEDSDWGEILTDHYLRTIGKQFLFQLTDVDVNPDVRDRLVDTNRFRRISRGYKNIIKEPRLYDRLFDINLVFIHPHPDTTHLRVITWEFSLQRFNFFIKSFDYNFMQGFPHTAVRKTWNFCMPAYKEYLNIPVNKSVNSPFLSKDYIRLALPVSNLQNSVNVIMFFLLVGFLFKLAVFPVHGWALDVYSGLSYSTLNIFLNVIKILFSYKLIQVFFYVFQYYTPIFVSVTEKNILFFVSISSIIWSSLLGISEKKIKKILAYSSINNLGFILLSTAITLDCYAVWERILGVQLVFFYLIIYVVSNLLLLNILAYYEGLENDKKLVYVNNLNNLKILDLFTIVLILFSFAGIPPLAGFFGKYYILFYIWNSDNYFAYVPLILMLAVFSSYFYIKVVKTIFSDVSPEIIYKRDLLVFLYLDVKIDNFYLKFFKVFNIILLVFLTFFILFPEKFNIITMYIAINVFFLI